MSSNTPRLNPKLVEFVSDLWEKAKSLTGTHDTATTNYAGLIIVVLISIVALIALIVWYVNYSGYYETKNNITRISKEATQAQVEYAKQNSKRIS